MISYPIFFEASAHAHSGMQDDWKISALDYNGVCTIPKSFEGAGGNFTPEDYFLLSVINCFVASFKVYATYSKFEFKNLDVSGKLEVGLNEESQPRMKSVHLKIKITGASNEKKAQVLTDKVLKSGFIIQSVKSEITHELEIT